MCQAKRRVQGRELHIASRRRAVGIVKQFAGVGLIDDPMCRRCRSTRGVGGKGRSRQRTPGNRREDRVIQKDLITAPGKVRDPVDVGCGQGGVEHERIGATATRQNILAQTTVQEVIAQSADQRVIARTAAQAVVARVAGQIVCKPVSRAIGVGHP